MIETQKVIPAFIAGIEFSIDLPSRLR